MLYELFEEQVEMTPNQIALIIGDKTISYKQLYNRVHIVASHIMDRNLGEQAIVAMMFERSIDMVVALLAVMKTGLAFLPIDITSPQKRIDYMLADTKATLLLSQANLINKFNLDIDTIDVTDELELRDYAININKDTRALAYIIYTSGSTGNPKGVMIEERSLYNSIVWRKKEYGFNNNMRILQLFSYCFDGFLTSLLPPITSGSTVVLLNEVDAKNPISIKKAISKYSINHFICVPSLYLAILECVDVGELQSLDIITLAGEKISARLVELSKNKVPNCELVNEYGPTENSIVTTCKRDINQQNTITLGKPIDNTRIYVVDNGVVVKQGHTGELCVSGIGLARGYLNNRKLTDERFINNPFERGTLLYKTGDLVKVLANNDLEFIGRIDEQVKINGYRIELGEIEKHIIKIININSVTVVPCTYGDKKSLVAFYKTQDNIDIISSQIKQHLSASIPGYMIPNRFIRLDQYPIGISGKVDRKKLINIANNTIKESLNNETNPPLLNIWCEVLGRNNISVTDNFFELGGNSLDAMRLIANIYSQLDIELSVNEIFGNPIIKDQIDIINSKQAIDYSSTYVNQDDLLMPLTDIQKRIYISSIKKKDNLSYNLPNAIIINGNININKLNDILNLIIDRHNILSSSVVVNDGDIYIKYNGKRTIKLKVKQSKQKDINAIISEFIKPFDLLHSDELYRVELIRLEDCRYLLLFDIHHIIFDGISFNIIIDEVKTLICNGLLKDNNIQYRHYVSNRAEVISSSRYTEQVEFWRSMINEHNQGSKISSIPVDNQVDNDSLHNADEINSTVGQATYRELCKLAIKHNTTPFNILLTAYIILLHRNTGNEEIIVGIPVSGRNSASYNNIVGMFVNVLPVQFSIDGDSSISELLDTNMKVMIDAYDNQDIQINDIYNGLNINNIFVMQQDIDLEDISSDFTANSVHIKSNDVDYDIAFNVCVQRDDIRIDLIYDRFKLSTYSMKNFMKHYLTIVNEVLEGIKSKVKSIDIISSEERNILDSFATTVSDNQTGLLHDLFTEQAEKTPDNACIEYEETILSYSEVDNKSNIVANYLIRQGISHNERVGIKLVNPIDIIISILGVLKSGSAYVPLDPSLPDKRIAYMIEDSGIDKIIDNLDEILNHHNIDQELLEVSVTPNDLAYIIYTSGSTGKPKGVMVEHRNIYNTIQWRKNEYRLDNNDRVLQLFSYSFDGYLTSLFTPIVSGARVIVMDYIQAKNPSLIAKSIYSNKINHFICVPTLLKEILKYCSNTDKHELRMVTLAGEKVKKVLVNTFMKIFKGVELINEYGPTENSVATTICRNLQKSEYVTIGKPISNTNVHIVDKYMNIVPIGVQGEICISGQGVARGYLNHKELTNEKFIDNNIDQYCKLYRTGDVGRWLPDGNIDFIDRIGNQVKLRGLRIELEEIEEELKTIHGIIEAVVKIIKDSTIGDYLCAYYLSTKEYTDKDLRQYLGQSLPEYMIPAYFIRQEKLNYLVSGKLDRNSLPIPEIGELLEQKHIDKPSTTIEEELLDIWSNVLNIDKGYISIDDRFNDIGGNSLLLMELYTHLEAIYPNYFEVVDLFAYSSIKEQAEIITKQSSNTVEILDNRFSNEYIDEDNNLNKVIYKYAVNNMIISNLHRIADMHEIEVSDILISMYAFMLSEIIEANRVNIYAMFDITDALDCISLVMDEYDGIGNLLDGVHANRNKIMLGDIDNTSKIQHHTDRSCIILNGENRQDIVDMFDLAITVFMEDDDWMFTIQSNNCIEENLVEDMIIRYTELLELLQEYRQDVI